MTPPRRFELQPTTRFADRASDYALFRPSYPKEAVDAVLAGLPGHEALLAADIEAGTGVSSRLLADLDALWREHKSPEALVSLGYRTWVWVASFDAVD